MPPTVTAIAAQAAGRSGYDLRISVTGGDPNGDAASLWVSLRDGSGNPVPFFDSNLDGEPDSAEGPVGLQHGYEGQTGFEGVAVLRDFFQLAPTVTEVSVTLRDTYAATSEELSMAVVFPPSRGFGEPCDPAYLADRCESGLGCYGEPATCQEGRPPEIARIGYYKNAEGPRVVVEGTEPEDDLDFFQLEFLDLRNQPVRVDLDADDVPESTSMEYGAAGLARDGAFALTFTGAAGFETEVPQLAVTPIDLAGHIGARKTIKASSMPNRSRGAACSITGFDACSPGNVCHPGLPGATNKCEQVVKLQAAQCGAAPALNPAAGVTVAVGRAEGGSLWDAPAGCQFGDPKGRPEGVVKLLLARTAAKLTLSTVRAGTDTDTAIYLLKGCPETSAEAVGCNDDTGGTVASTLVLTDVPAGEYTVVVESFNPAGGNFELSATVE